MFSIRVCVITISFCYRITETECSLFCIHILCIRILCAPVNIRMSKNIVVFTISTMRQTCHLNISAILLLVSLLLCTEYWVSYFLCWLCWPDDVCAPWFLGLSKQTEHTHTVAFFCFSFSLIFYNMLIFWWWYAVMHWNDRILLMFWLAKCGWFCTFLL